MKAIRSVASLRDLREQPLWKLLAADKAPEVVAMLRSLLYDGDKAVVSSVLHERLGRELEELRAQGENLPQAAPAYVQEWLRNGWLSRRRLAQGASEEEYELSVEAGDAIRFLESTMKPRTTATESRLSSVMQQISRLAEETDSDPKTRVAALQAERDRLDREIERVRSGVATVLSDSSAIERAREIIGLTDELAGDFRRVRDDFDRLNRGLRQSLMENEGSRGQVLDALFAGVDIIGETDAGKTFSAFWRLLTDPVQSSALYEALDAVVDRPFARQLEPRERKFLMNLVGTLMDEGSAVHDVLQTFARSLKSFVQSREFQEHRRLHSLLKATSQAALAAKDLIRANQSLGFELKLTTSTVRSVAQWTLYDPDDRLADAAMSAAEPAQITLESIGKELRDSEIDFRTLRSHIRSVLERRSQACISQILAEFPAEQGLGSIVGYVSLGAKHGEVTNAFETVRWVGRGDFARAATVPTIYFMRERYTDVID